MPSTEVILAAAAHEHGLPISHIKGFVTSLLRTDVKWDNETRRQFLIEIDLETDRLAEYIKLLCRPRSAETRRVHYGAAARELSHPAAVIERAFQRIRSSLQDRRLRLDLSPTVHSVRMNGSQIERVLANLIQNAIKYSPQGTEIRVSARIVDDCELQLSVEDEGPGIPAAERERIFEPFFRRQTPEQSEVSGYGLGLAICRSIVRAHGGRIQVTDRPGGGARFSVFLPTQVPAGIDSNYQLKEQANGPATDSATYSRCGGRSADEQAALQQPQGQRLRRTISGGYSPGASADTAHAH